MKSHLWSRGGLVVLMLMSACGSGGGDATPPASTSIASTSTTTSSTIAAADLTDDPVIFIERGGPDAQQAMDDLDVAIVAIERACSAASLDPDHLVGVVNPLDRLGAALEPVRDGASPSLRKTTYRALQARIVLVPDCQPGAAPGTDEFAVATALVTAALDRFYGRVVSTNDGTASEFWGDRDRLFTALWMRDLATPRDLDVMIVGASVPKRAFDPELMSNRLELTVGNAATRGNTPELTVRWLDEVRLTVDPATVVWGFSAFDLYGRCFIDERVASYQRPEELRLGAYGPVRGETRAGWEPLLGPIDETVYTNTTLFVDSMREYHEGTRGRSRNLPAQEPSLVDELMGLYSEQGATGDVCQPRMDILVDASAELEAEGTEVIVVALPSLDQFAELHPDGIDGQRRDIAAVGEQLPDDVTFVDLSAPMDDELFADVFHPTEDGRVVLTEALLDAWPAG